MSMYDARFDPEPPRRPGWHPALIAGALLFGFLTLLSLAVGAFVAFRPGGWQGIPARAEEPYREKLRAAREAFEAADSGADRSEERALRKLFVALADPDRNDKSQYFDFDRMLLECRAAGLPHRAASTLRREVETSLPPKFHANVTAVAGTEIVLRHVDALPDERERLAWVQIRSPDGQCAKQRFWLRWHEEQWRIFDYEDLELSSRMSSMMAGLATDPAVQRLGPAAQNAVERLAQAGALTRTGDFARAEEIFNSIGPASIPRLMRGFYVNVAANVHLAFERSEDALEVVEQAEREGLEMPSLLLLKSQALHGLGRAEEARLLAEEYLSLMGDDPLGRMTLGHALSALGRRDEAAAAYRRGLELHADSGENLIGLALALSESGVEEVRAHFARMTRPELWLVTIGERLTAAGRYDMLLAVAEEYRRATPGDANADFYKGLALRVRGEWERAAEALRRGLSVADEEQRPALHEQYRAVMVDLGDPLSVYREAADPAVEFERLAGDLWQLGDYDSLRALVDAHRANCPDDLRLEIQEGWLDYQDRNLAAAAERFQAVMTQAADEALRYEAQSALLSVLVEDDRMLEGYRAAVDPVQAVQQLASALDYAGNAEGLERLLAAHAAARPDDDLTYFRARALFHRRRFAEAAALLDPRRYPQLDEQSRYTFAAAHCEATVAAGQALEAYRAAPDASSVFQTLAAELLVHRKADELERLVEEHALRAPEDSRAHYYRGYVQMLRDQPKQAAAEFAKAMETASDDGIRYLARNARIEALFTAEQSTAAYESIEPRRETFAQLWWLGTTAKNATELEALLILHRQRDPDDPQLGGAELDLAWLRQDYAAVAEQARRCELMPADRRPYSWQDYLLRALVRLGRSEEAMAVARAATAQGRDPYYEAVVHAAAGRADDARGAIERSLKRGHMTEEYYLDEDLGPHLRGADYAEFRRHHPPADPPLPERVFD